MDPKSFVFRFGEFEVPERELRLTRAGETLALEPKALRVLLYLLHNPGRLVTKDELLNAVWGDTAVTENSLTRVVALLRKVLDDDIRDPQFIATVPTAGYRFISPVAVSGNGNQASAATVERPEIPGATNNEVFPESKTESQIATIQPPAPARDVVPTQSSTAKRWLVLIAAGLACVIGAAAWYWSRPLPPLHVTEYAQITHNGYIGALAGTDGSRIYFNMNPWGPIAQVGVNGGDIVPISAGSLSATAVDVSSDGARLLLWNPQGIFTMGTAGGSPRFILDLVRLSVFYPAFSPDGKSIAYAGPDGSLFSMKVDGTDDTKLATGKGEITDFAWSPDGVHLRFTRDNALWDMSSTGGNLHPVFPDWKGPAGQCCGRWTPDGDFYLFLAGGNQDGPYIGGFEQIWALDERRRLFRQASRAPMQLTSGLSTGAGPSPVETARKSLPSGPPRARNSFASMSSPNKLHPTLAESPRSFCPSPATEARSPMSPIPTESCGGRKQTERNGCN
jgi:DNA-binding winged helix-turn-helix (wHTH) protein